MAPKEKKELWIEFAHSAMSAYAKPDDIEDADDLVEDMVDVASGFADAMFDAIDARYGETTSKGRRRKSRKKDEDDE